MSSRFLASARADLSIGGRTWLWGLALSTALGCGEQRFNIIGGSTTSAPSATGSTRLRLEPEAFLGRVPCAPGIPGALHYYVAFIDDLDAETTDAGVSTLRVTTPVVPCGRSLHFDALSGRRYAATIRGFDERIETDPDVAPSWRASCGRGSVSFDSDAGADPLAPTLGIAGRVTRIRGCTTFRTTEGELGSVVVDTSTVLGSLECGNGSGQVARVRARGEGAAIEIPCGCAGLLPRQSPGFRAIELEALGLSYDAGSLGTDPLACLTVEEALAAAEQPMTTPGDAGATGGLPQPGTPAELGLDAGAASVPEPALVADAGTSDAGMQAADGGGIVGESAELDASVELSSPDSGVASPTPPSPVPLGVLGTTTCVTRVVAGATSVASCDPF